LDFIINKNRQLLKIVLDHFTDQKLIDRLDGGVEYELIVKNFNDDFSIGILICLKRIDIEDTTGVAHQLKSFHVLIKIKNNTVSNISDLDAFVLE